MKFFATDLMRGTWIKWHRRLVPARGFADPDPVAIGEGGIGEQRRTVRRRRGLRQRRLFRRRLHYNVLARP